MKNKRNKDVYETFDIIIEQDFNPDFVRDGLFEMYNDGIADGIIVGGAVVALITSGYFLLRAAYKKIRAKYSKEVA